MKTLEVAILLGAEIIEKHFTYDKRMSGNDHYHSMDKEDLKLLKKAIDRNMNLLGSFIKKPLVNETSARKTRQEELGSKE